MLPELLRGAENWRYLVFGVLLIVVMLFRPQGIWPYTPTEPAAKVSRRGAKDGAPEPEVSA